MKHSRRAAELVLLTALGCAVGLAQVTNPLGGVADTYRDVIRLRMEQNRIRALNEESAARAVAIRAQTEQIRSQQQPAWGAVRRENLDDGDWTAGMLNGRGWRKLDYSMKVGFALG